MNVLTGISEKRSRLGVAMDPFETSAAQACRQGKMGITPISLTANPALLRKAMRRRDFIRGIAGSTVVWPLAARAQQPPNRIPVVGVLWHAGSAEEEDVYLSVLVKAFHDLSYEEGKNIRFEHRFPAENPDRFQTMARELVDLKPDAIIAVTAIGAVDVKKLTSTIPIVFVIVADPIGSGLVEGLARPGGNATGLSLMAADLSGKHLALLKEAVPNLSRVALVVWPAYPFIERIITNYEKAARDLGMSLWPAEISGPDDVEPVFEKMVTDRADGFALTLGPLLFNLRARIGASALAHHLPGICFIGEEVPYGFMMSYGQDFPDYFRRAVTYTDKILKGAKPADLPVEQPTTFKLILNLKTASALGLGFPRSLILSADEMIGGA
jgi:putative tryptophan/tyrosine transport system substrate-binding protein